ncbi:RNA-directed DNA polymerase, eukaryota, reverse transcriptase zinc-binding domain protein, partial [Tanacetum coccineum]
LIVQQWNHQIGMQKAEHSKLHVWVRMTDVPLKAWSIDGISALASSLGNPLIMDNMTAKSLPEDDPVEIRILKDRMIVDQYINKKMQPSVQEVKNWSQDMTRYFKEQWEKVRDKDKESSENEEEEDDIMEELNELEGNVLANEITGRDNTILHQ